MVEKQQKLGGAGIVPSEATSAGMVTWLRIAYLTLHMFAICLVREGTGGIAKNFTEVERE